MPSQSSPSAKPARSGRLVFWLTLCGSLAAVEYLINHTNLVPIPGSLTKKAITPQQQIRDKNHSSLPEAVKELVQKPATVPAGKSPPIDSQALPSIELTSQDSLERLGIRVAPVELREMAEFVETNGIIDYDQTRIVKISSRVPGMVWRVERDIGDQVRQGELLAILEATRVGEAKSEFLQSVIQTRFRQATLERLKKVKDVVTERQIREAEASLREARIKQVNAQQSLTNLGLTVNFQIDGDLDEQELIQKMHFLGLPGKVAAELDPASTPASLIPVTAPFDGVVTHRNLSLGEVVETSTSLFSVADVTRMWIILNVRKEDADRIRINQPLSFLNDNNSLDIQGLVQWISPEVDSESRTVEVRGEVENPFVTAGKTSPVSLRKSFIRSVSDQSQRKMQANSFGKGKIEVQHRKDAIAVPQEAVQSLGLEKVVFVPVGEGLQFEPRIIRTGIHDGGHIEVLDGLHPGESVVTSGSHVLKSELVLKSTQAASP